MYGRGTKFTYRIIYIPHHRQAVNIYTDNAQAYISCTLIITYSDCFVKPFHKIFQTNGQTNFSHIVDILKSNLSTIIIYAISCFLVWHLCANFCKNYCPTFISASQVQALSGEPVKMSVAIHSFLFLRRKKVR